MYRYYTYGGKEGRNFGNFEEISEIWVVHVVEYFILIEKQKSDIKMKNNWLLYNIVEFDIICHSEGYSWIYVRSFHQWCFCIFLKINARGVLH